jgi:toxin ParE1/3/4
MSAYRLTPQAVRDLEEIHEYIARTSPVAADRLTAALERRCELLAEFPEMGAELHVRPPGLRSFTVKRFLIVYRPADDGIQVIRFLRGSRDLGSIFLPPD